MDYACIQEKDYTPETNVIVFSKVTDTAWFCNRDKLKKKKKKKKKNGKAQQPFYFIRII